MFDNEFNELISLRDSQTKIERLQNRANELNAEIQQYTQKKTELERRLDGNNFNNNLLNNNNNQFNQAQQNNNIAPRDLAVINMRQINNQQEQRANRIDSAAIEADIAEINKFINEATRKIDELNIGISLLERLTPQEIEVKIARIEKLRGLWEQHNILIEEVRRKHKYLLDQYGGDNFDDSLHARMGEHFNKLNGLKITSSNDVSEEQLNEIIKTDREFLSTMDKQKLIIEILCRQHDSYLRQFAILKPAIMNKAEVPSYVKLQTENKSCEYKNQLAAYVSNNNQATCISELEKVIKIDQQFLAYLTQTAQTSQLANSVVQYNNVPSPLFSTANTNRAIPPDRVTPPSPAVLPINNTDGDNNNNTFQLR